MAVRGDLAEQPADGTEFAHGSPERLRFLSGQGRKVTSDTSRRALPTVSFIAAW